jgi:hypothetical protein
MKQHRNTSFSIAVKEDAVIASEAPPTLDETRPLSLRRLLLPGVLGLFLLLQVAIPLMQFAGEQPSQFSWQMFANKRPEATYDVVLTDGSVHPIDLNDYVGRYRVELDYRGRLPLFVCDARTDAAIVRVYEMNGDPVAEVPCQ